MLLGPNMWKYERLGLLFETLNNVPWDPETLSKRYVDVKGKSSTAVCTRSHTGFGTIAPDDVAGKLVLGSCPLAAWMGKTWP